MTVGRRSAAGVRWPAFAAEVRRAGFNSVRALPLRMRGRTLGGLTLFDIGAGSPTGAGDLQAVEVFADLAVLAVHLHGRLGPEPASEPAARASPAAR